MDADQDITIGIDFQQVSIHGVKHKAPGERKKAPVSLHHRFKQTFITEVLITKSGILSITYVISVII